MKLEEGDIITVHNPLLTREYPVTKIDRNKAITEFRVFNRKIYCNKFVYEYGKRLNAVYNNIYTVKKENA